MTVVTDIELLSAYLDIIVNACRYRQYSRVELLLPGAIYDADHQEVLDSRLVSIVHDLAAHYIDQGDNVRAKKLFQDLIELKRKISAAACHDGCEFEQLALQQLSNENGLAEKIQGAAANLTLLFHKLVGMHHAALWHQV